MLKEEEQRYNITFFGLAVEYFAFECFLASSDLCLDKEALTSSSSEEAADLSWCDTPGSSDGAPKYFL